MFNLYYMYKCVFKYMFIVNICPSSISNQYFYLNFKIEAALSQESQEADVSVPSGQHHLRGCHRIWNQTRTTLHLTADQNECFADKHRPIAHNYQIGHKVWVSTQDITLKGFRIESWHLESSALLPQRKSSVHPWSD